jgi:hypothetical protein
MVYERVMTSKNEEARALFQSPDFPREMINEIMRRLTVTEKQRWRHADPMVFRLFPTPSPSINWSAMVKHHGDDANLQTIITALCQPVYDDDIRELKRAWPAVEQLPDKWGLTNKRLALMEAVAMGGATQSYKFLSRGTIYEKVHQRNARYDTDVDRMVDTAAAHGQMSFIQGTLGMTPTDLLEHLLNWDPNARERFHRRMRHPVVRMANKRQFSHVAWFISGCMEKGRQVPTIVLRACCAYGDLDTLSLFKEQCNAEMINYTLLTGTSSTGLVWLQTHCPHLFTKSMRLYQKRHGLLKCAARRGSPAVLQWLLEFDYLDLKRDGRMVYDIAMHKKYVRVQQWFKRVYAKQFPAQEDWPKWLLCPQEKE